MEDIERIVTETQLPNPQQQGDNLVIWLGDNLVEQPDEHMVRQGVERLEIAAQIGAADENGAFYICNQLENLGLVDTAHTMGGFRAHLTFAGWQRYEHLKHATIESRIALMAMPFGNIDLDNMYRNVFKKAVKETGFGLRRIDEEASAGLIDNRLRVELRRSRFVIAELTSDNSGAYWEAGYAEGLGRPVIYTCERKYFDNRKTHFDTNHCLTILWSEEQPDSAAEELKATIRATLPAEAILARSPE